MTKHDSETASLQDDATAVSMGERPDDVSGKFRIMRIAGGSHDNDNDEFQGSDGHDDTGHGDHDLSNQDPDSDD